MNNSVNDKRYFTFRRYLRDKYQCTVRKIPIHSNLSCPNRDGTIGTEGCIFCNNLAFYPFDLTDRTIHEQISTQINRYQSKANQIKFIAYFQTYTNTYAPVEKLHKIYDSVRAFKDIVSISIGTRPDCINTEILDLIESYQNEYEVWIEFGMQTSKDATLNFIRRGHTYQDFLTAIEMTKSRKINICIHVILGLPGETRDDMLATAKKVAELPIQAVKFHPLQVIRETPLEQMYQQNLLELCDMKTYVDWVVSFIEYLPKSMIIQRITADAAGEWLVAPEWCRDKMRVINRVDQEFLNRKSGQGLYFHDKKGDRIGV